jgi:hypothetical protein
MARFGFLSSRLRSSRRLIVDRRFGMQALFISPELQSSAECSMRWCSSSRFDIRNPGGIRTGYKHGVEDGARQRHG